MAYEKVPCKYNLLKDLTARIHGTICRYDEIPMYVKVESQKQLLLYPMVGLGEIHSDPKIISPDDPKFDISSPELGYVNIDFRVEKFRRNSIIIDADTTGIQVLYAQRHTHRQWKQGLNSDTTTFSKIDSSPSPYPTNTILYSGGMYQMLTNDYPPLPAAVAVLNRFKQEKFKQIAVSKDVALKKSDSGIIEVFVKRDAVGYILPGERKINLTKTENSWITRRYIQNIQVVE